MLQTQKNVQKIARSLGIRTTKFWMDMLQTLPLHRIGAIKVSSRLIEPAGLQQLAAEMAYLAREVGFFLPMVLGKNPRVQSRKEIWANQQRVVEAMNKEGAEAVAIDAKCIIVQSQDTISGSSLHVATVDTQPIIRAIYDHKIPVLSHLGFNQADQAYYELTAITIVKELVKWLQASKLIVVGDRPLHVADRSQILKTYTELCSNKAPCDIYTYSFTNNCWP